MFQRFLKYLKLAFKQSKFENNIVDDSEIEKEIAVYYKFENNVLHAARVLTKDNKDFKVIYYDIYQQEPEVIKQIIISSDILAKVDHDLLITDFNREYDWYPNKGDNVLFIQILPDNIQNDTDILDFRRNIELQLSYILEEDGECEWIASDIGPYGANFLFNVNNTDTALQMIQLYLEQNNLENNTLIGRRINIDEGDWIYEVIYPLEYTGDFYTI
jgi:hypothetical protein